ncbi:Gfo/Idh/MocA family oxidoreductase, partial [Streptomyces sp. E11-3]|uniref:Gfo/Idh/MocA family protein n=1 Tax=Streptomyces sp. E11-3 TaxID=3110112 RepID=UPI0039814FD9
MLRRRQRPLRTAIVGTGAIAGAHADALRRFVDRAELVAAADTDAARLSAFCEHWRIPGRYAHLDDLLSLARPDVVHLCTPPGLHKEQALACLRAGATVLCEKPPALSLAELDEIAEAERASGAHFAAVFQQRFGSGAQRLRTAHASGALGRPLVAHCHTLWFRPDTYFDVPWRGTWESEGGGPTMGHGIHQFDLLLSVLGPWREVSAIADRLARPTRTEDVSCVLVSFENGALATVVNSLLSPRETSSLRFDFEYATVEVDHLYGYDDKDWCITPAPGHEADVLAAWESGAPEIPSGHVAQLAEVLDALEHGTPPPVALSEARDTLEFAAATYASAFKRRIVRKGETGSPRSPFHRRMQGPGAPWTA